MELIWQRLDGLDGHTAGRDLLRRLCGGQLPEICITETGKPYFPDGPHFSISHSQNHAFCAISHRNIGIDAEEMDRKIDLRLAKRMLSQSEMARFLGAPDQQAALLRLWVLKESYAKLTGRGLGNYLKNTDFDPEDERILEIDGCYIAVLEE